MRFSGEAENSQHDPKRLFHSRLRAQGNLTQPGPMAIEKSKIITVRFEPDDEAWILRKAEAAGLKKSTYIREVALGNVPQDEDDFSKYDNTEALQNLQKELLKIGNNVNQMARVANSVGAVNGERLKEIKEGLRKVNSQIMDELL